MGGVFRADDLVKEGLSSNAPKYVPYLDDEYTSRDIFGVVRGACVQCGVARCRRYVKATADYTLKPEETGTRPHPSNDVNIMRCSNCGCPPEAHEKDEAETLKEEGNEALMQGKLEEAMHCYTKAIEIKPWEAVYYSNRSAVYLAKKWFRQALFDSERAIEIEPQWAKPRARKAVALAELSLVEECIEAWKICTRIDPQNDYYRREYAKACTLRQRRQRQQQQRQQKQQQKQQQRQQPWQHQHRKSQKNGNANDTSQSDASRPVAHAQFARTGAMKHGPTVRNTPTHQRQSARVAPCPPCQSSTRAATSASGSGRQRIQEIDRQHFFATPQPQSTETHDDEKHDVAITMKTILERLATMESAYKMLTERCDKLESLLHQRDDARDDTGNCTAQRCCADANANTDVREYVDGCDIGSHGIVDDGGVDAECRRETVDEYIATHNTDVGNADLDDDDEEENADVGPRSPNQVESQENGGEEEEEEEEWLSSPSIDDRGFNGDTDVRVQEPPNFSIDIHSIHSIFRHVYSDDINDHNDETNNAADDAFKLPEYDKDDKEHRCDDSDAKQKTNDGLGVPVVADVNGDNKNNENDNNGEEDDMWRCLEHERLLAAAKLMASLDDDDDHAMNGGGANGRRKRHPASVDTSTVFAMRQKLRQMDGTVCLDKLKNMVDDSAPFADDVQDAAASHAGGGGGGGGSTLKRGGTEKAKATKIHEERKARVRAAFERRIRAETTWDDDDELIEPLITQDVDVSGMKRVRCSECNDCPGFVLHFFSSDTTNPDIMFNCSACGCPASAHPVCPVWAREQEEKKREDEKAYRRWRSQQQQHSFDSAQRTSMLHEAYAKLQLRPGTCERDVSRAYKRLARLYHPDKGRMKDGTKFIELTAAFKLIQQEYSVR